MPIVQVLSCRLVAIGRFVVLVPLLQWCIGVFFGSLFPFGVVVGCAIVVILVGIAKRSVVKCIPFVFGIALVSIRVGSVSLTIPDRDISYNATSFTMVEGVVSGECGKKPDRISCVLSADRVCTDIEKDECEEWHVVTGKVQVFLPRYPAVGDADRIVVTGLLERPRDSPDSDFSYEQFLHRKDIYSVMYRARVLTVIEKAEGMANVHVRIRGNLLKRLQLYLPEPHAALLGGMLLGVEGSMPVWFSESLRITGTTHIIAASGYNVAIVATSVDRMLSVLSRKKRLLMGLVAVWSFVLISGASIPVIRAGLMVTMATLGTLSGNTSVVHVALPLSAALLVLADPRVLYDLSFQLSFSSTFGLIYVSPVIDRFFAGFLKGFSESVSVTLSAIVASFPVVSYHFGSVSVVALIANILVAPTIAPVMGLGVFLIAVSCISRSLAIVVALPAWVILRYFVWVVECLAQPSWAIVEFSVESAWICAVLYVALGLTIVAFYPGNDRDVRSDGLVISGQVRT
ncbi:MAG: ComEC/Rec2 family competence protein [Candidatus Dojkabacteria bacterium]|nr:ComEC/Rec2 family competence protein [Candidatus Dojkabacteria bacterium]